MLRHVRTLPCKIALSLAILIAIRGFDGTTWGATYLASHTQQLANNFDLLLKGPSYWHINGNKTKVEVVSVSVGCFDVLWSVDAPVS